MKNKNMDESNGRNRESKERILLLKRILSPNEYRRIVGLPVIEKDNSIAALTAQLKTNQNPEKDFWWSPLQDLGYLLIHAEGNILRAAIVADKEYAIVCELPADYDKEFFAAEWKEEDQ